jgi:hypothetical protein
MSLARYVMPQTDLITSAWTRKRRVTRWARRSQAIPGYSRFKVHLNVTDQEGLRSPLEAVSLGIPTFGD